MLWLRCRRLRKTSPHTTCDRRRRRMTLLCGLLEGYQKYSGTLTPLKEPSLAERLPTSSVPSSPLRLAG